MLTKQRDFERLPVLTGRILIVSSLFVCGVSVENENVWDFVSSCIVLLRNVKKIFYLSGERLQCKHVSLLWPNNAALTTKLGVSKMQAHVLRSL